MMNSKKKNQNNSTVAERLTQAIGQAVRSAKFCVAGCLPVVDPHIEVDGLGAMKLPLKRTAAKELVACCQDAPYGKGTRTLIDKQVRNTYELDPQKFRLSDAWNAVIAEAMHPVAEQLGLPADQLQAKLYKLLVYEKGGFFLPHRDSEKHDRMVASMIVVLPNPFEGGRLVVRHGAATRQLTFEEAAAGKMPCYAAFYADCEHEVERVASGVRLCLAYNLVVKPKRGSPSATANPTASVDLVAESLRSWVAKQPAKPLVFALEHHYTQRGLSLDLLKGVDRQLADLVVSAAARTDCLIHLAQLSRHLSQFADDGSFDDDYSRSYRAPRRHAIEIGETYEDDLSGTEWADIHGNKQTWGTIAFDLPAIVSSLPLDDWKPTSEEFEGYTGNAGNTLDRWYHRSALVVWHRDHHFEVVASAGVADSVPLFCSMTAKLAKMPKKRIEAARGDCIHFAQAIIAKWPHRISRYWPSATPERSPVDDFPEHLLTLHDRDTIAIFLTKLAEQDQTLRLRSLVLAACREFGWSAFAHELKQLIASRPNDLRHRQDIPFRDIEWLSDFCCDKTADPDKSALAHELCARVVERFREPQPSPPAHYSPYNRREASISENALPLLLKAILASGSDEDLSRVIHFIQQSPDEFNLDNYQVPCLQSLISWSRQQFGSVPPQLAAWLSSVRQQLELATAKRPAPPTDWARPADVNCTCQYCAQLKAFLADRTNEVGRIPAREEMRQHLIGIIGRHQCDVKHALERKGSPYSLVLTKTNGSFDRAVKRFEADCRLLTALPPSC
ncbi:MAG: 2OG-Fe(II) oxygenase [Gemmataceae bacterium]